MIQQARYNRNSFRSPIRLQNRTNYFNPETSRSHNIISSPFAYQTKKSKIEGYECRLYWQFRYCQDNDGQTFFYTLTYNDKSCPHYCGRPCFDYQDLVYLLTGGFRKRLLRDYGINFKYFVGAELGEGKGKRGFECNPHYHVLFFTESAKDKRYPYRPISPIEFRHLIRLYWQGFDEDIDGWHDYKTAKFGIVKEGLNCGLVYDFGAVSYVAKYVTKDTVIKRNESFIRGQIEKRFSPILYNYSRLAMRHFVQDYLEPLTTIHYEEFNYSLILQDIKAFGLKKEWFEHLKIYTDYANRRFDERVRQEFNVYRNRYSNKCRISHGVGDYALDHIKDKLRPSITMPDKKKGWKQRPLNLYYYRKLYCKVIQDSKNPEPSLQKQNLYVLNELGLQYKETKLAEQHAVLMKKTASNLDCLDRQLFSLLCKSGYLKCVSFDYDYFENNFKNIDDEQRRKIISDYSIYKLVYEGRFFPYKCRGLDCYTGFPSLNFCSDYRRFLSPSFYEVDYDSCRLSAFLQNHCEGYLSFRSHPYFLQASCFFDLFDILADYFYVNADEKEEERAEQIRSTKQWFAKQQFINYLSQKFAV